MTVREANCSASDSCAAAVLAVLHGFIDRKVEVILDGGSLYIKWLENNDILMTGDAKEVFRGEMKNPSLYN